MMVVVVVVRQMHGPPSMHKTYCMHTNMRMHMTCQGINLTCTALSQLLQPSECARPVWCCTPC